MATALTTRASYKIHAGIPSTTTTYDTQIDQWVPQACQMIETWLDRTIGSTVYSSLYFSGNGTTKMPLDQWPVTSLGPVYQDDGGYYGTPDSSFASTASTTTSSGGTLPTTTLSVASTTGFDSVGILGVMNSAGQVRKVSYSAVSGTTFTGCSGGGGAFASGAAVIQAGSLLYEGTDYVLRTQRNGSGIIERINDVWADLLLRRSGNLSTIEMDNPGNFKLSYTAGYSTVPSDLEFAANVLINQIRFFSPFNRYRSEERRVGKECRL